MPRQGCLNFHNSLLPHNRGKHPNFWSLVEGRPYGVTLQFADIGVDTGAIAFQAEVPATWADTGGSLYTRGQAAIVQLFRDSWPRIREGDIPRVCQDPHGGSFHRARELEAASRIDLDAPTTARQLLNVLRARTFPPHPAARFEDNGIAYEVRVDIHQVEGSH
jgi:methionyl-tRNA formyltransferase